MDNYDKDDARDDVDDKERALLIAVAKAVVMSNHMPGSVPELKTALAAVMEDEEPEKPEDGA